MDRKEFLKTLGLGAAGVAAASIAGACGHGEKSSASGGTDEFPIIRCTYCGNCLPCQYGVDIPGVFAFYNEMVRGGSFPIDEKQRRYALERRHFLLAYNRAVDSAAQADHCIACAKCVKSCPGHIPIPREMRRIDKYIEQVKTADSKKA